jgi:hypothetical protein
VEKISHVYNMPEKLNKGEILCFGVGPPLIAFIQGCIPLLFLFITTSVIDGVEC